MVFLRYFEISEANHRILNPITIEQLMLLGEICRLRPGLQQLDLACGKAEMLCHWAQRYGIEAVGVDLSKVFLDAARQRAVEMKVADKVTFVEADAGKYPIPVGRFDIVSCIGATWIGGGLTGTLAMMEPGLRDANSLLLVGEPFWLADPPKEAIEWIAGGDAETFVSLAATLDRLESTGLELIDMVLANHHGWDRYEAGHWWTLSDWLRENPEDPDASEYREKLEHSKKEYFTYARRYLGWGVFVLRRR